MPSDGARELLASAQLRRIALAGDGIEIALLDWGGSGPLALLHHANGFCKGIWAPVAAALRDRFRVVAMDARGHGDSSRPERPEAYRWPHFAEDLLGVAERLAGEIGGGTVGLGIGHSFGGTSMLGAASRRPDLFERLLLVDPVVPPPPDAPPPPDRAARLRRLTEGARRRRSVWASRAEARAWFARREFFGRWDPRVLDLYVLDGLRERLDGSVELKTPGEVEATVFGNSGEIDVPALARGVPVKTLLLWAAQGDFPRETYEEVAASMADARVETVESGHLVPMERPDLVVAAARRLGTTGPRSESVGL